jgi:hypothetical protein
MASPRVSVADHHSNWVVHGSWPCGHAARIDLGRFLAWEMHDVPMVALCRRLRCPECGGKGPAEVATGWLGTDPGQGERSTKVRELKPRDRK